MIFLVVDEVHLRSALTKGSHNPLICFQPFIPTLDQVMCKSQILEPKNKWYFLFPLTGQKISCCRDLNHRPHDLQAIEISLKPNSYLLHAYEI